MFKKKPVSNNFRDRFSPEEWSLVMSVPFLFFGMIASADGTIDQAEAAELQRRMQGGAIGYKDPLHREVAAQFFSTPVTLEELLRKANQAGPEKVRDTLRKRLTDDEYQGYLSSVLIDSMGVAQASGGVSDTETTALTALATFFGIDVAGMKKRFS
ncbi:MAG TPA: hypothetical protein VMX37_00070 [Acidimicrobiia bacterium]|jgi:hypothetical protein|nr:hypothetical protein [Acidimicrobiia bacterium]